MHLVRPSPACALAALVLLVSCAAPTGQDRKADFAGEAREEARACPLMDSGGWQARITRPDGPEGEGLIEITGNVTTRSGGYGFSWEPGPLDRSMTPVLRLELVPSAPVGPAIQAITSQEVTYTQPLGGLTYRGVLIFCGDEILADIGPVPEAR